MKTIILGLPFEIILREPKDREDGNFGSCDAKLGRIQMDKTMPRCIQDQTLVHEWIHGVITLQGCSIDETAVSVLAAELYREGFRVKVEK